MKVVCINNIFRGEEIPFTIGKVYETKGEVNQINGPAAQYSVMSDDGEFYNLSTSRFISLEEWREKQLDKIL
jgi:hypothetical protein